MQLHQDTLNQFVTNCAAISDRKLAIVSITGRERQGKSFLLSYTLKALEEGSDAVEQWSIEDTQSLVSKFPFKNGTTRFTRGISIWHTPIPINDELAVVLMDTQGIDGEDTKNDLIILGFTALISSVQIYNTMHNLNTSTLEQLELFLQHSKDSIIKEDSVEEQQYQRLIIVVRDFSLDKKSWGLEKGQELLLKYRNRNKPFGVNLTSLFEKFSCLLMPNPGEEVSNDDFDGSLNKLSPNFVTYLKIFIEHLKDGVQPKHVLRCEPITSETFCWFIQSYFKAMTTEGLRNLPKTAMEYYLKESAVGRIPKRTADFAKAYAQAISKKMNKMQTLLSKTSIYPIVKEELDAMEKYRHDLISIEKAFIEETGIQVWKNYLIKLT